MDVKTNKKIIEDLQKEVYQDYVKYMSVYEFLTTHYAKDLSENTDKLRQDLKKTKELAKDIDEKDIEKMKEAAIKIANLDGRIIFVEKKIEEVKKAKGNVNEVVSHYHKLKEWLDGNFTNKEPELIK